MSSRSNRSREVCRSARLRQHGRDQRVARGDVELVVQLPLDRRPLRLAVPQCQEPAQGVRGAAAPVRLGRVAVSVQRRPDVGDRPSTVRPPSGAASANSVDGGLDELQVELDLVPRRRGQERLVALDPHQLVDVPAEQAGQPGVGSAVTTVRAQHRGQAAVAVGRAVLQLLEPRDGAQVGEQVVRPPAEPRGERLRDTSGRSGGSRRRSSARTRSPRTKYVLPSKTNAASSPLSKSGREVPPVVLDRPRVAVVGELGRRASRTAGTGRP